MSSNKYCYIIEQTAADSSYQGGHAVLRKQQQACQCRDVWAAKQHCAKSSPSILSIPQNHLFTDGGLFKTHWSPALSDSNNQRMNVIRRWQLHTVTALLMKTERFLQVSFFPFHPRVTSLLLVTKLSLDFSPHTQTADGQLSLLLGDSRPVSG